MCLEDEAPLESVDHWQALAPGVRDQVVRLVNPGVDYRSVPQALLLSLNFFLEKSTSSILGQCSGRRIGPFSYGAINYYPFRVVGFIEYTSADRCEARPASPNAHLVRQTRTAPPLLNKCQACPSSNSAPYCWIRRPMPEHLADVERACRQFGALPKPKVGEATPHRGRARRRVARASGICPARRDAPPASRRPTDRQAADAVDGGD